MPLFEDKQRQFYVFVSYKGMYSTILGCNNLRELGYQPIARHLARYWLGCLRQQRKIPVYQIVRNPYDRLVSFFFDKFRRHLEIQIERDGHVTWEHSQRIFFPSLGLSDQTPNDEAAGRFLETTFSEFMALLPFLYRKDPHIAPQSSTRQILLNWNTPTPFRFPVSQCLRMEDQYEAVLKLMGKDSLEQRKKSSHKESGHYFDATALSVANKLYRQDFQSFGYAMREATASLRSAS